MKELRILFTVAFLLMLASFSPSTLAHENESEHRSSGVYSHQEDDDNEDDDKRISNQNRLKAIQKINAERRKGKKTNIKPISERTQPVTPKPVTVTPTVPKTTPAPKPTTPVKTPVTPTPTTPVTPVVSTPVTKSATVTYRTPDGSAAMGFSATVKGGIITAASSTVKASGTSGAYQQSFAPKLSAAVVGKKAAGLNVSVIAGASLTTTAFEQFIAANF